MKKIIVTLTHRIKNIEFFAKLLDKQLDSFDEWHIWFNSKNNNERARIQLLIDGRKGKIIEPQYSDPDKGLANVPAFWKIDSTDSDAMYIKFDDDIVWMENNLIQKLFDFKLNHPNYFIVSANVINNAVISYLHMRFGHIPLNHFDTSNFVNKIPCTDNFLCHNGWANPIIAEYIHKIFIEDIKNNNISKWYFPNWILDPQQMLSINTICWMGQDMNTLLSAMNMGENDEYFIMNYGTARTGKRNIVYGNAVSSHYAFHTQKSYLDSTEILKSYHDLLCLY